MAKKEPKMLLCKHCHRKRLRQDMVSMSKCISCARYLASVKRRKGAVV